MFLRLWKLIYVKKSQIDYQTQSQSSTKWQFSPAIFPQYLNHSCKIPKSPISVGSFPLFLPGVLFCHASIYSLSLTQLCLQAKHCPPALSQIISAKKSQAASSSQSAARTQRLLAEMTTEKRPLKRIRVKNIHLKVVHQLVYQFQRHLRTTVYVISFSFVDV